MKPRIAIVGTGWGTRIQLPTFRAAGWKVTALWARTADKARTFAAEHGIPFATSRLSEILDRDDVDLVSVVAPPHTHAEWAIQALESGKHVLCEKPTALDAGEAERMVRSARAHPHLLALIDHELRFDPPRQRLEKLVRDGYVGDPLHAEVLFRSGGRLPEPDGSFRFPWNWWSEAAKGGGILGALGSHAVDALLWLLDRPAVSVSAQLGTMFAERPDGEGRPHPVTADDYASLRLTFDNPAGEPIPATLVASTVSAGAREHRVTISGTAGRLATDGERLVGVRTRTWEEEDLTPALEELPDGLENREWTRGTYHLAQTLRGALQEGDPELVATAATFEDGLAVQRVLDAARESSARGGVPVSVPG